MASRGSKDTAPMRSKSQVRFAVEEDSERHSANSFNNIQGNGSSNGHSNGNSNGHSNGSDSSFQGSFQIGMGMGHGTSPTNPAASNPQMKINRNRSISRSMSSLEIQFKMQQEDKYDTIPNKLAKGLFALMSLIIALGAMVLAKVSIIYMSSEANVADQKSFGRYIVAILSVLTVPLLTTFLSDLMYYWVRETKEKKLDPKAKKVRPHAILLIAILEGIIEAVGISIFIMMVLPLYETTQFTKVFLLNGLCVIPVICALVMKWSKWLSPAKQQKEAENPNDMELDNMEEAMPERRKKDGSDICSRLVVTAVQILFLCMQLGGIGLLTYYTKLWWEIPVSLILTSASWWKNYVFTDRLSQHWSEAFKRHRYASSLVKTAFKIGFIYACVVIIAKYKFKLDTGAIFDSSFVLDVIKHHQGIWWALLGCYVAYYTVWTACLACMQIFCFALPVLLVTPLALFYQTWDCKYYIFGLPYIGCSTFTTTNLTSPYLIAGGVLLWVSFVIISGHLWTGVDKRDANQLEPDMWAQPENFNPVFIEQSLSLNRNRNPKIVKSLAGDTEYGYHAHRTYITTTMYHESKEEMQKLVMSLLAIDAEIPTEDKVADYYECHIIFDDAFLKQPNPKPDHFEYSPYYNEWVFYLLDIFQELKLKKLGDPVIVWYGEVLTFRFALGMKLVVHLKDVSKIRQKKRWSQILYMHVILEDVLDNENKLGMLDSNTFILMIDGDTQFTRKAVNLLRHLGELDRERSGAVCGRIFPEGSSNPVVWYQKFEYAVGHWMQKTAEHVFGTVLCSPGCFSLVRIAALYRKQGEPMDGTEMPAIESYSKEVTTAMDVLQFDQGEDRMLSTLIVMNGWRLQYCAGAEAGTFCPMGFGDFFKQRRRWISSTLANLYFLISESANIVKTNTSVSWPFMLYTAATFASSIFGPATIILVVIGGMGYAFRWEGPLAYGLGVAFPLWYLLILVVFNLRMETDTPRKKSKKIDIQVAWAFILCALYCCLMAAVIIGTAAQMVGDPVGVDAIFLYTMAFIFVICATLHGEFFLLTYGIVYLFFLPTMYLVLIMFAMANTHDQSWGTRDGSGGGKASEEDKFFSIAQFGAYIRDIRHTFKEALYDKPTEKPKESDDDDWRKTQWRDDDGKEEIVMLEEERRRLEEEKKKAEEEKRKQEEEKKLREIERQKEEARKKKLEAEEREKLQERLKQERRRGIHHPYKDKLSSLSRRLKNRVVTPEKVSEKEAKEKKQEQIRSLAELQQMMCFLMCLCTAIWLLLVIAVSIHPSLNIIGSNAVGIMFLIAFGIVMILQVVASVAHRVETMFNAFANIPMTFDCGFIDEGRRYERMKQLQQQAETEPVSREGVAAKVARKLLLVDKRTATKANLRTDLAL